MFLLQPFTKNPPTPKPSFRSEAGKSKSSKRGRSSSSSSKANKTSGPTRKPTARGSKSTKGGKSGTRSPTHRPSGTGNEPSFKPTTLGGKSTKSAKGGGVKAEKTPDTMSLCTGEACQKKKRERNHAVSGAYGLSSVSVSGQQ